MRNRSLVIIVLAALAAILPAGAARANGGDPSSASQRPPAPAAPIAGKASRTEKTFIFYGSGWGHGIGLSQWGAYGLATRGWDSNHILTHFYTRSQVQNAPSGSPTIIRVGLTWDRGVLHLAALGGPVALRFGSIDYKDRYKIPQGATWTVRIDADGHYKLFNNRNVLVATTGGPKWKMFAAFEQNDSMVRIPEAGHPYAHGFIEFNTYKPCSSCAWLLRAIGVMTPDKYLYGLGEVPSSWPMAAMKAQAVAGRTYAFYMENWRGLHRDDHGNCNCGVYPTSVDQAYIGWDKEADSYAAAWRKAVDGTSGKVVTYRGDVTLANYYSASGGYTEDNENVWFDDPIPYLRAVCDPGDYVSDRNSARVWSEGLTQSQVTNLIDNYYDVGTVTSFGPINYASESGRIISITVNGSGGRAGSSASMKGPTFSSILGLMDDKVWIDVNRNVEGAIRNRYDSLMCAPGLARTAAFAVPGGRAQKFADGAVYVNSARESTSWLHGMIYKKFKALGGVKGLLGLPRTSVMTLRRPKGCGGSPSCFRADFDGGRIYQKVGVGTFEVHGPVLGYYLDHGGAGGALGFPTSDVKAMGGGTVRSTFEHGIVTCPATGPCVKST